MRMAIRVLLKTRNIVQTKLKLYPINVVFESTQKFGLCVFIIGAHIYEGSMSPVQRILQRSYRLLDINVTPGNDEFPICEEAFLHTAGTYILSIERNTSFATL